MAFHHGKNLNFKLDNSSGTLTDLTAYVDSVDFPYGAETHETTTGGASAKTYIAGLKDGTLSISGPWDPTLDAHMAAIVGLIGSFEFNPAGTTATYPKYTGECLCQDYQVGSPVGDKVTWSATLQITGAVTRVANT